MLYTLATTIDIIKSITTVGYIDRKVGNFKYTPAIKEGFTVFGINELIINSNIDELTSTATFTIPNKLCELWDNTRLIYNAPKSGDRCDIGVGDRVIIYANMNTNGEKYTTNKIAIFIGYISSFQMLDSVVEIGCQDSMYRFKKRKFKYSFSKIKLSELVKKILFDNEVYIYDGIGSDTINTIRYKPTLEDNIDLGEFKMEGYLTGAQIFQKIKEMYRLNIYFKNYVYRTPENEFITVPMLQAGLKYPIKDVDKLRVVNYQYPFGEFNFTGPVEKPTFDENLYILPEVEVDVDGLHNLKFEYFNPIIDNGLKYNIFDKTEELVVVGTAKNGKETTRVLTIDGKKLISESVSPAKYKELLAVRPYKKEINIKNGIDYKSLSTIVKDTWNNHPDKGFEGSFTVFGEPLVRIGDVVQVRIGTNVDYKADVIQELYYVNKVTTTINQNSGYTQNITVDVKLK